MANEVNWVDEPDKETATFDNWSVERVGDNVVFALYGVDVRAVFPVSPKDAEDIGDALFKAARFND